MRIVFPTLTPFPSSRAPAVQVANMAQAFAELGHAVELVVPAGPENATGAPLPASAFGFHPDFAVVTLSRRVHRGQSYLHAVRIARLARGTDLVFSRNLRACLLPALRGIPTVYEAHTLSSLTGPQERWVLRRLAAAPGFRGVVAISRALADDLERELGLDPQKVMVAHDAVRLDADHVPDRTAPDGAGFVVGYTGALFPGKGSEMIPALAARLPEMTFRIAGGPPDRADALRARVAAEGLDNVIVHGPLTPAESRALQRACDVLVAPFARRVESDAGHDIARWTSPMKLFEYMASGRPIVSSDLPVLREILRPDIDALMVPAEDVAALAAAVRRLADDAALRARLAEAALQRVREHFTWERRAATILERFVPAPQPRSD
jgi:glycosyltransferase involved in cell wall biosynthesis